MKRLLILLPILATTGCEVGYGDRVLAQWDADHAAYYEAHANDPTITNTVTIERPDGSTAAMGFVDSNGNVDVQEIPDYTYRKHH